MTYWYSSKAGSITGTGVDDGDDYSQTYDLTLQSGWNKALLFMDVGTLTCTTDLNGGMMPQENMRWLLMHGNGGGGTTTHDPTVTSVTVTAANNATSVAKGGTLQFSASVAGTNSPAQTVTWSIVETGKKGGTTISASGLLTVASDETLTAITVKATSTVDPSKSNTKRVTVTAGGTGGGNSTALNGTWNKSPYQLIIDGNTWTIKFSGSNTNKGTVSIDETAKKFTAVATHNWSNGTWVEYDPQYDGTVATGVLCAHVEYEISGNTLVLKNNDNEMHMPMNGTWTK
jgi:hypothetical protein